MEMFNHLKIKHKISLLCLFFILSFFAYIFSNILIVKENRERLSQISSIYYPVLEAATITSSKTTELTQSIETAVTIGDEEIIGETRSVFAEIKNQLNIISKLQPSKSNEVERLKREVDDYYQSATYLANGLIMNTINFDNLSALAKINNEKLTRFLTDLADFKNARKNEFTALVDVSLARSDYGRDRGIIIGVAVMFLVLLACYLLTVSVTGSLRKVSDSLKEIAQGNGDLTVRIQYPNKDEVGLVVYWFNQFLDKLHGTISETIESIESLSIVSEQLAESSSISKIRIQEQTKSISQVSHSMNEMFDTVKHIANYASKASTEASSANSEAIKGTQVVEKTIEAIHELADEVKVASGVINDLEEHTSNVGVILKTIRGIADQTNLLALNAAIEAARAGDQGRGFAVVASEVRTLASRTQDSTQEIQKVIEELQSASVSAVEAMQRGMSKADVGVERSSIAGDSLSSISVKVENIHMVNENIASATEEQSQTAELINGYIDETNAIAAKVTEDTEKLDDITKSIKVAIQNLRQATNQFSI